MFNKFTRSKRYLIKCPIEWYGKYKMHTSPSENVTQIMLHSPIGSEIELVERYIKDRGATNVQRNVYSYDSIYKNCSYITKDQYDEKKIKLQDLKKLQLTYSKFKIVFNKKPFILYLYSDVLNGLAILEVDKNDYHKANDIILLPPYFSMIKEITDDEKYYCANLASIHTYSELNSLLGK